MDSYSTFESFTKLQNYMTKSPKNPKGSPAIACGGNCGAAAWVLTHSLLRRSPIALIGIDLGYPEGTPLTETGYYSCYMQSAGGDSGLAIGQYKKIFNPYFKCYAYVDKVFENYRKTWLSMAQRTELWARTCNCTEGGTLFGDRIESLPFKDWLESLITKRSDYLPMCLRTNDKKTKTPAMDASSFAKLALSKVGGSCVYIEPKKTQHKLLDTDSIE